MHDETLKPVVNWLIHTAPLEREERAETGEPDDGAGDGAGTAEPRIATDLHGFQRRVEALVRRHIRNIAGRLQVISLAPVRKTLDEDRWRQVADTAIINAETVIRRHLLPGDACTRYSEDSFLVLFAALGENAARAKARQIETEIHDRLVGRAPGVGEFLVKRAAGLEADGRRGGDDIVSVGDVAAVVEGRINATRVDESSYDTPWGNIRVVYRPTVESSGRRRSIFAVRLRRRLDSGRVVTGEAVFPRNTEGVLTFEFDYFATITALEHFRRAGAGSSVLILPLHYHSLADRNRAVLLHPLKTLEEDLRKRLWIEIVGVPSGTPASRFSEVVGLLKTRAARLLVRADPGAIREAVARAEGGISAMGIDLGGDDAAGDPDDDPLVCASIAAFVRPVRGLGVRTYCFGIATERQLVAATEAGYDLLNGPAVADEVPYPALPAPGAEEAGRAAAAGPLAGLG